MLRMLSLIKEMFRLRNKNSPYLSLLLAVGGLFPNKKSVAQGENLPYSAGLWRGDSEDPPGKLNTRPWEGALHACFEGLIR